MIKKIKNLIYDVQFYIECFICNIKVFKESIFRIVQYIPVIWKNRDFDFGYNLELFKYSLSRLRKNIKDGYNYVHRDKIVREILITEKLIERLINDEYVLEEYRKLRDNTFNTNIIENEDGNFEFICNNLRKEDKIKYIKALSKLSQKEKLLKKNDMELLCSLIAKKSGNWWI